MSWAAANIPSRKDDPEKDVAGRKIETKRRGETVEAVMSRLSKAYSVAMECFGAIHEANARLLKNKNTISDEEKKESVNSMHKLANACRTALENAVLSDPLVVEQSPTLRYLMQQFAEQGKPRWIKLCEPRPEPPKISSKSHNSTIRHLSYLALTIYSDLLTSVCTCSCARSSTEDHKKQLLDRGVVKKLEALSESFEDIGCCWTEDSEEDIQRLALVSLCDASALDGSDPVVWLKLACAARAMGHIKALPGKLSSPIFSEYRRLERHALENGFTALPPNLPPNRAIAKALEELNSDDYPDEYPPPLAQAREPLILSVDLTRYSWSFLGRVLMNTVRDGSFPNASTSVGTAVSESTSISSLALTMSPMLVLPSSVLGKILSYLEIKETWNFEATCRALSVSIMSVRATQEKQGTQQQAVVSKSSDPIAATGGNATTDTTTAMDIDEVVPNTNTETSPNDEQKEESNAESASAPAPAPAPAPAQDTSTAPPAAAPPPANTSAPPRDEPLRVSSRSSKRVRSQQINSDKKEERSRKRQSVEFCLRAATCGSLTSKLQESHGDDIDGWDTIRGKSWHLPAFLEFKSNASNKGKGFGTDGSKSRQQFEASERIGSSSLLSFLSKVSSTNSHPTTVLDQYLGHVALHAEEVFLVDPGDVTALTASVLGCLELALQRQSQASILPQFFDPDHISTTRPLRSSVELFAIDVLHTELRFKSCERQLCVSVDFDDDSNYVCSMLPVLLQSVERLDEKLPINEREEEQWIKLKTRVNWLAAGVFLWRSRITLSVDESIEAEDEGLKFIDSTIENLGMPLHNPIGSVATPHLESPVRTGAHWKKLEKASLDVYRDEIKAASVVSHAQQQFQEKVARFAKLDASEINAELNDDDMSALSGIGETLLARYNAPFASPECKHGELLDNFIAVHGVERLPEPVDVVSTVQEGDTPLPISSVNVKLLSEMANPSILTILITCLQVKSSNHLATVQLLIRLVLSALNRHERIIRSKINDGDSPDHFSDTDSVNDDASDIDQRADGITSSGDAVKFGRLITYLLDRLLKAMSRMPGGVEKYEIISSDEFLQCVHHSLGFCSLWGTHFAQQLPVLEEALDCKIFLSVSSLLHSLTGVKSQVLKSLEHLYFRGLVRILESQRQCFESLVRVQGAIRARRAVRQRTCILRAEFIGTVFCEVGKILSENLFSVVMGKMVSSAMVEGREVMEMEDYGRTKPHSPREQVELLCEALLWFSRYLKSAEGNPANSFDRPIIDRMRVPLATAVAGFCGAASCTRSPSGPKSNNLDASSLEDTVSDQLALKDFLDSDESAHELSDSEAGADKESKLGQKELLRVSCHLVHTCALVFGKLEEKEVVSFNSNKLYRTDNGPLLPLVVARVLNHVADMLLQEFEEEGENENEDEMEGVWSSKYPFATGGTGLLLDSALHKAYKCLHGFNLSTANDNFVKEFVSISSSEIEIKCFTPESLQAAAQLYRCIVRAGKKTPPKAALETVSSALPPLKESAKTQMISDFLFSPDTKDFRAQDIVAIITKSEGWKDSFRMTQWDKIDDAKDDHVNDGSEEKMEGKSEKDEIMFLRKGVFSLLAQGDLPVFSNEVGGKEDDRAGALRFEEELSKKFVAILNTLKYGDANDIRGWYRAAQCLMLKAEVVAERLGMSKGFSRSEGFFIPEHWKPSLVHRHPLSVLEERQERELVASDMGWVQYIGDDLSCYINYHWSGFESLKKLSEKVAATNTSQGETEALITKAMHEINSMQGEGRLMEWQQSWGGMFVAALKKMAVRCMCFAIYLFSENPNHGISADDDLLPEIYETLGVTLYASLLGSQSYGYPMHVTPSKRKRQVAEAARACFRRAIEVARGASDGADADTWDLLFMIGKCYEKIASTYKMEHYHEEGFTSIRRFEAYMKQALDTYQAALDEKPEVDHSDAGGSSHGATEIFYRIHASRLKCLLESAKASEHERPLAEAEALRLTEINWFKPPSASVDDSNARDVRGRIWNVLADIVAALAQCRFEHPFFHRSVYRHAQALMWSPYFCDPVSGSVEGSRGTVPATRSCHIRGLNHATSAANSAFAIMNALFEKKRSQLCAVWVTLTPSPTPFENLNNSVRKYDSLRGKYIAAYIECLRLCSNRNELETLLRWLSSSKRDLPSFYQASAKAEGGKPEKSHNHDCLLKKESSLSSFNLLNGLKRQANSAMAYVLAQELSSSTTAVRSVENHLKLAYACFMRQNCSLKEFKRTPAWKYDSHNVYEAEAVIRGFLKLAEAPSTSSLFDPNDWSGGGQKTAILEAALVKCKQLFPSVSGSYYSKKANSKFKGEAEEKESNEKASTQQLTGTKRSFEVKVPEGLGEGETFTTTIQTGEISKKVKLTVPGGKPRMLRFSLDLSSQPKD